MGMFDWLVCEKPLPDLEDPKSLEFQTKDTPNQALDTYTITKDGRLIVEEYEYEDVPEVERPDKNHLWIGCMRRVEESKKIIDLNFHGFIRFYGNKHTGELMLLSFTDEGVEDLNHPGPPVEWFEYEAKFTDGNVEDIKRIFPK